MEMVISIFFLALGMVQEGGSYLDLLSKGGVIF